MIKIIKLGDTGYPFRYSVNAFVHLQDHLGIEDIFKWTDIKNLEESVLKLNDAKFLRFVVWNGIRDGYRAKEEQFTLTEEDIGDLIVMDQELYNLLLLVIWGVDVEKVKKAVKDLGKEEPKEDKKKASNHVGRSTVSTPSES